MFKFYRRHKDYQRVIQVIDAARTHVQLDDCYDLITKFYRKWENERLEKNLVLHVMDRRNIVSEIEQLTEHLERERKIYEQKTSINAKGESMSS